MRVSLPRISSLLDRVQSRLRVEVYRRRYRTSVLGKHLGVRGRLIIKGPGKVVIGDSCFFDIATGHTNIIQTFSPSATVTIGDHCYLNGIEIASQSAVTIGPRCILADCLIMDTDFHSVAADRHDASSVVRTKAVEIARNVWVGNRSIILKGVHIGENSVVGAGTVVRQSVPPDVVVLGNPQQIVKRLTAAGSAAQDSGANP